MTRLVSIVLTSLFMASCGGGGSGPVPISVPDTTNISVSTNVVANSFLSAIVDIAQDKQIDINEAYSAFQWVENNPNFDPSSLANVNIVIDGETMTLEEGYYALKGFKQRYYDGKESLWSMAVEQGQFDDASQEYLELEQIGAYDAELTSEEKLDLYKQQGQDQKVIVKKSTSSITSTDTQTSDPVEESTVTQRTESIENDNGSTTVNVYDVTTTVATVTTTVTTTVTPITTFTWSDGATTQQQGTATSTSSSTQSQTETVSEELVSSTTNVVLVSTAQDSIVETETTVSDPVIIQTTSTRTETVSNANGSTTTNTYTTTVTTTTTTTTVTTTTTARTIKTYSDGSVIVELDDPVINTESTNAVETTSTEVLTASVTTQAPTDWNTAEFEFSTGLGQINADAAYERGWTGAGVTVGLIDTGIDTEHTDFDQDKVTTIDFGYGTYDDHGHGTHVAGIMAASKNDEGVHGVAFDANIVSLKLCDSNGRCPGWDFDEAMLELSNNGVDIANLSANIYTQTYDEIVGQGLFYLEGQPSFDGVADDTLLNYKQAVDNGMIIVNSAGNRGRDYPDKPSHYATRVDENGDLYLNGQWLIVGAVGSNNEITSWSNKAGHICSNVVYTDGEATGCDDEYLIRDFFVVAPGSGIYSTAVTGGNMPMSGTSQAAPYVTGSLAILKQAWPQLQPEQLVGLITSTALDLGDEGVDDVYGHGLVDLDAATQPQGDIVAVQPSGNISKVSGGIVGDSTLSALDEIADLSSFVVMDSYNRDYTLDMNSATNFELVERPLMFSYQSYQGLQQIGNFAMSNDGSDIQYSDAINDTFDYTIGYMTQQQALFGSVFEGSLAIDHSATRYIGIDARRDFNNWYLLGAFAKGWSSIDAPVDSYVQDSQNIQSQSYYLGVGSSTTNSSFELKIGTQLHITHGAFNYDVPTDYDWTSNTTNFTSGSADASTTHIPYVAELDMQHDINEVLSLDSSMRYTTTLQNSIMSVNLGLRYAF